MIRSTIASIADRFRATFDLTLLTGAAGLRIERVDDPMDFSPAFDLRCGAWVPTLHAAPCVAAGLEFDGLELVVATLPPSYFDVRSEPGRVLVVFGIETTHHSMVNGRAVPSASLGVGGPGSRCVAHWPHSTAPGQSFVVVSIPVARTPIDWPRPTDRFLIHDVAEAAMARLRRRVVEILLAAAGLGEGEPSPELRKDWSEALIDDIDAALHAASILPEPTALSAKGYLETIEAIDEILGGDLGDPVLLDRVARDLGMSRRTIHNVMLRVRGVTLQSYLRIQRLRCVRRALLLDRDIHLVKQAAMRYGFLHLGRFAVDYTRHFGEAPSATLARRGREAEREAAAGRETLSGSGNCAPERPAPSGEQN